MLGAQRICIEWLDRQAEVFGYLRCLTPCGGPGIRVRLTFRDSGLLPRTRET